MSLAYFIEQNTCKAHFSMISAGNYPPTEGECLVCENQRLRARLEPFLAQEREQNAANRVAVESVANKKAAAEAEDAMNDHHAGIVGPGSIKATPIVPPVPMCDGDPFAWARDIEDPPFPEMEMKMTPRIKKHMEEFIKNLADKGDIYRPASEPIRVVEDSGEPNL